MYMERNKSKTPFTHHKLVVWRQWLLYYSVCSTSRIRMWIVDYTADQN